VDELRETEGKLRHLAYHDPLTGLANRVLLQECTEQAVERQRTEQSSLGVVYIDLDDFKAVNDRLGHAAGDALLVMASERMRACTRPSDTVARLGGDEFIVLLPGLTNESDAETLGRRLVDELSRPFVIGVHVVQIGASVGVAVQPAGVTGDPLRDADIAMYNAKFSGKNSVVCFDSMLRDRIATAA
jgi:diguanylate cyclase (GGDEF)-like protein